MRETLTFLLVDNKDAIQPAHPRTLSASLLFAIRRSGISTFFFLGGGGGGGVNMIKSLAAPLLAFEDIF